jgi:hypothetical protein
MAETKVCIDTSVWIEYFRGRNGAIMAAVDRLLDNDQVVTLDVVEAELLRGARTQKEIDFLEEYFVDLPRAAVTAGVWRRVGLFCHRLARKGYLPHLVDAYIAVVALENDAPVFSRDGDFKKMASLTPLKLHG